MGDCVDTLEIWRAKTEKLVARKLERRTNFNPRFLFQRWRPVQVPEYPAYPFNGCRRTACVGESIVDCPDPPIGTVLLVSIIAAAS